MTIFYDDPSSSAAYRVRLGLALAGVPHERALVELARGAHRAPDYLRRNPQGLVPALEIDGLLLTQSLAILEYLDETRHLGLLPADPAGRARVRALAYVVAMETHPVCNSFVARYVETESAGAIPMRRWMERYIPRGLDAFEALLDDPATGACCHGDRVSLADLCLVPQLRNARIWGLDVASWSRCAAIEDRLQALPAFRAAHPDNFKAESS